MMGGIIVGTLLTLLFLPALYVAWFRVHAEPNKTQSVSDRASAPMVNAPELTPG